MHDIICKDETFDPNFTIEYKLSIQVGLDGFSFSILDDIRKKFLVFQYFSYNFKSQSFLARKAKEIIKKTEILQNKYKSVTVLFVTHRCTIIPSLPEYTDNTEELLNLSFDIPPNNATNFFNIENFKSSAYYSYPEKLKQIFEENYQNCTFTHQLESVFNHISKNIEGKINQASVVVNCNYFNLIVYKGKQLLYFNSFDYHSEQDLVYFILLAFKSLQLRLEDLRLHLTGNIIEESPLHQLLKNRFPSIKFSRLNTNFHYSYTFDSLPQHQFLSVINPEG